MRAYTPKSIYSTLTCHTLCKLQKFCLAIPTSNVAQGADSLGAGYDLDTFGCIVKAS